MKHFKLTSGPKYKGMESYWILENIFYSKDDGVFIVKDCDIQELERIVKYIKSKIKPKGGD